MLYKSDSFSYIVLLFYYYLYIEDCIS